MVANPPSSSILSDWQVRYTFDSLDCWCHCRVCLKRLRHEQGDDQGATVPIPAKSQNIPR